MNDQPVIRPSQVTFEGSVFFTVARVAEAAGRTQAKGGKRRCSRQSRVIVSAEECMERFLAGDPVCVNEFHGRCSTGALELAKISEDEMGKTNYGKCIECGRTGNRDSAGRCYRPECKAARGTVKSSATPAETILTNEETADAKRVAADADAVCDPRSLEPDFTPDLPEDPTTPFVLAGIQFAPLHKRRQSGENYVTLRTTSLGVSTAAEAELGLKRYTHARYTVSLDGTAVAIKFLTEKKPGALCVNRSTGSMTISAQPLATKHPELIGKKGRLEETDVRDWFVVRFVTGEAK